MKPFLSLLIKYPIACTIGLPAAVYAVSATFMELAWGSHNIAAMDFEMALQEKYGAKVIPIRGEGVAWSEEIEMGSQHKLLTANGEHWL